ncbi:TetR/AcrR family transcriptional regulator [Rhizobium sp. CG5]|uniref:TetR/AcrR family transcriptional regulator n=1 Tax=Rhizobium sp. CG5 TaxID=2726076 RepID=UPI0020344C40|nr:TetR/AcrR family transcriptional regulator [Rhizobium sp. CG5]MCM2472898.1 TetR/AcrR family transcriptional regulator [Rhizobium sp. CG5]
MKIQRDACEGSALRRQPKQDRSRERLDEILKVAMELIGSKGLDAVTMKEIATNAGGPIASVYQYFPNKSAIIATLYERYALCIRALVADKLTHIDGWEDVGAAAETVFDAYFKLVSEHPPTQDLLNAIQADTKLNDADVEETRLHANMFSDATQRFIPEPRREQYRRTVFLMFCMAGGAVRLALMFRTDETIDITGDFKAMIRRQLRIFASDDAD